MGYRQLDHTADVALEIWAPSEEELLAEGGRAIIELLVDETELPSGSADRTVTIEALDPEDRLVRWLNEILSLAISDGYLLTHAALSLSPPGSLHAELKGQADGFRLLRNELKSVTYHDLRLWREGGTWRARVVIDV